jgi:hypothetical protein|nr:MAG TPA: hypothetical protein [Caudoviricetes sp.]
MAEGDANLDSKQKENSVKAPGWIYWGIGLSLLFSIIALVCTFVQVRVEITHETYVGTMITILGIIVAIVLGYQIVNYIGFEKKIIETVDNKQNTLETKVYEKIDNKLISLESDLVQLKLQMRLEIMIPMLRNSLIVRDWELSFNYILPIVNDVVSLGDDKKARFIVDLLFDFMQQNDIDYVNVTEKTLTELIEILPKLKDIVYDKDQMFKDSFDFIFSSFIKEVNKYGKTKTGMGN